MKPKIKLAQGGRGAMEMLAKGEVDIGLTFISEIITEPGVEVVGPLPRDIFDADGSRGLCICTHKGPRRRASAAALFVLSRSCGGL